MFELNHSDEERRWEEIRRALADVEAREARREAVRVLVRYWPVLGFGIGLALMLAGTAGQAWVGLVGGCVVAVAATFALVALLRALTDRTRPR